MSFLFMLEQSILRFDTAPKEVDSGRLLEESAPRFSSWLAAMYSLLPCRKRRRKNLVDDVLASLEDTHLSPVCCFLCRRPGHVSVKCPSLPKGAVVAFRSCSDQDHLHYRARRAWTKDGEPLTPSQHIEYGNVKVPSKWFSCALQNAEPAFFWSTRHVVDNETRPTRGHNWETKHIAAIDVTQCEVLADVHTAALAASHGIIERRPMGLAISNSEVILKSVPHSAVLAMRSVQSVCCEPICDGSLDVHHASPEALDRWCLYAQWSNRSRYPEALRPPWLQG